MSESRAELPQPAHPPTLPEPQSDPIRICRSCGACVNDRNPSPCQQERCAAMAG